MEIVCHRFHQAGLRSHRPAVRIPLTGRHAQARLTWAHDHARWTVRDWTPVLFTDKSRFCLDFTYRRARVWRIPNERFHTANISEHDRYAGGSVMVWGGKSVQGKTDLHVIPNGNVTAQRYCDKVLDVYVRPYAGAIDPEFILMDDNAHPHRAQEVNYYNGIFGVPKDLCTQQYFRAVTEYSHQDWKSSSSLEEVHFVDKDQGMVSLIATTFSDCCEKDGKMKQASQNFGQMQVKGFGSKSFSSSRSISSSQEFRRRTSSDSEENHEDFSTSRNSLGRSISKEKSFTGSTIGKDENCCICMDEITDPKKLKCGHVFCRDCIDMQFQYKPVCPNCGAVHGKVIGDQPPGTMKVTRSRGSLEGYKDDGIIMIAYSFPAGVQGPDHPHPGTPYEGIYRAAYLPNNKRGKLVCKLLEIAFDRKLVFTIGRSRTTGKEGVVTWNDIHHKTRMDGGPQRFGYPDPTYLDRVMEELEVKGVTEESLNDP